MSFTLDPELREYATDRQWKLLEAYAEHGTQDAAAEALGCAQSLIGQALKKVGQKAAQHGYAPERDLVHKTAAGMTIRGTSILYDRDGEVRKYWSKTRQEGRDPEEVVQLPDPKTVVKLSTLYDQEGRVTQQWIAEKPEAIAQAHAWEVYAEALAREVPCYDPVNPPASVDSDLMVGYPVGDHHMGMLAWAAETGESWDLKIAERALMGATDYLVERAPSAESALIAFLGDFMHYDSMEPVTPTSRNQLDADSRFPKMVDAAVDAMRYMIRRVLEKHQRVHVIVEIGNHDLSSSIFLMKCLSIGYENEPRVTVDTSPRHFHYFRFGEVLVGTHHGHGVKMQQLPLIMAADRPGDWGATRHRYWWTGHQHTGKLQAAVDMEDFSGCTVERFRVLATADAWAAQKGYRAVRGMKAIVLHRCYGEVARNTVSPEMFREDDLNALERATE